LLQAARSNDNILSLSKHIINKDYDLLRGLEEFWFKKKSGISLEEKQMYMLESSSFALNASLNNEFGKESLLKYSLVDTHLNNNGEYVKPLERMSFVSKIKMSQTHINKWMNREHETKEFTVEPAGGMI